MMTNYFIESLSEISIFELAYPWKIKLELVLSHVISSIFDIEIKVRVILG